MATYTYVGIMLGVILVIALVVIPSLFRKKCQKCGARNALDAKVCVACRQAFPDES
jgi:hypothetical protein